MEAHSGFGSHPVKKLRRKIIGRLVAGLAVLIAISATLFLTLPILLPNLVRSCSSNGSCGYAPLGYMIAVLVGVPLPIFGSLILAFVTGRRLKLVADRMAGELVGTAYFLGVLNKISNMAQGQVMTRKRMGGPLSPFPSLASRIVNLQNSTAPN